MRDDEPAATAHEFGLFLIGLQNGNDLGRGIRRQVGAIKRKFDDCNWSEQKSVVRCIMRYSLCN